MRHLCSQYAENRSQGVCCTSAGLKQAHIHTHTGSGMCVCVTNNVYALWVEGHAERSIVTTGQHVVVVMSLFSTLLGGRRFFFQILEVGTRRPTSPPVGSPRPVLSKILLTKSEVCPATGGATAEKEKLLKMDFQSVFPLFPFHISIISLPVSFRKQSGIADCPV